MAYIFLDKSGDLGFSKKSSKWFLFTIAIVSDPRLLEKVIKKVWKWILFPGRFLENMKKEIMNFMKLLRTKL